MYTLLTLLASSHISHDEAGYLMLDTDSGYSTLFSLTLLADSSHCSHEAGYCKICFFHACELRTHLDTSEWQFLDEFC
jgi:hypothetical protein